MIQKTSAPGSAEPQLRNACVSFWSVKAELGLRGPGKEGLVFFKVWYHSARVDSLPTPGAFSLYSPSWAPNANGVVSLSPGLDRRSRAYPGSPKTQSTL